MHRSGRRARRDSRKGSFRDEGEGILHHDEKDKETHRHPGLEMEHAFVRTSLADSGQSTVCRPSSRAACSTGVGRGVLLLPRPRGFPGWLTTAAIWRKTIGTIVGEGRVRRREREERERGGLLK